MELLTFALSGLLLGLVWQFMLKRTILDDHRDQLFDLRDELRDTFVKEGWSMDAPIYKKLRNLINGYLRFTETYSFGETYMLERSVRKNEQLSSALNKHFERSFHTEDLVQRKYIKELRKRARTVMMSYMILSSGPLVLALFPIIPLMVVFIITMGIADLIRVSTKSVALKVLKASDVISALLKFSVASVAKQLWDEDFVEEMSYRQNSPNKSASFA